MFVSAIGPSLAARLAAHGIRVATARPGTPIATLLRRLGASPERDFASVESEEGSRG